MKKILAVLAATTALTTLVGLPAYSSFLAPVSGEGTLAHLMSASDKEQGYVTLASNDAGGDDDEREDDEGEDEDNDEDDDTDEDSDEDEDEDEDEKDDEGEKYGSVMNPTSAEANASPENGLFANGEMPKVRVN